MPALSTGEVRALDVALLEYMRAYRPADAGPCLLDNVVHVTLPISEWATYGWVERFTFNVSAGNATPFVVYTLPVDERARVIGMHFQRTGGDNLAIEIDYEQPAEYGADTTSTGNRQRLLGIVTANVRIFWPYPPEIATVTESSIQVPFLLEPGGSILFGPSGAGASASTFRAQISMEKTKLVRTLNPAGLS